MEKYKKIKTDDKRIEMFKNLNIKKSVSKTLLCLSTEEGVSSTTICQLTGLKQPEVSNAIKCLEESNWVSVTEVKSKKAGRPIKYYRLLISKEEIYETIEKNARKEVTERTECVERLKELVKDNGSIDDLD
ncbi:hypothetical protein MsAg5_07530 [Methanosarcinaceae archaeon Ag5]|uniref:Transcriptional regulator n=1 Tax=Methanolapillus africanus TaxID=3028297 RepID=A0AAE4SF20_9EURY|nr:hypothetical protein [Methanosarcinaceae archaeon Ag5]